MNEETKQQETLLGDDYIEQRTRAPIPGESLTLPPKSMEMESPPQYTDPEQALEKLMDAMVVPQNLGKLKRVLEAGAPAEAIAKTQLFQGVAKGKWTPDLAMAMVEAHTVQVAGLGDALGVKNMKILMPLVERGDSNEIDPQEGGQSLRTEEEDTSGMVTPMEDETGASTEELELSSILKDEEVE